MGDPLEESTDIGTVINRPQLEKIERYIALGKSEQVQTSMTSFALI